MQDLIACADGKMAAAAFAWFLGPKLTAQRIAE